MDYSRGWIMRVRRIGQRLGILRPLQRAYRSLFRIDYEQAFDKALIERICPGDTVWDVGANIGHYTGAFAAAVGEHGRVIAFEPSPSSLPQLRAAAAHLANTRVEDIALSNQTGDAEFFLSETGASANEGLSAAGSDGAMRGSKVRAMRGDELVGTYPPNVIKIDVEGFEREVIEGMGDTLSAARLHTIAIEVHFQTLARRGAADAPRELAETLAKAGFSLRWTDPSHLIACRDV